MFRGDWDLLSTTKEAVYILSEAPVTTWERFPGNIINHGVGFHRPNIEVILSVSPRTCLPILPRVNRERKVLKPTVSEINAAQAGFAYLACFANQNSGEIDSIVQGHISTVKLGQNAFTVYHRNYDNAIYDILMNGGRWVEPPRVTDDGNT